MKAALLLANAQNHALVEPLLRELCDVLPVETDPFTTGSDLIIVDSFALSTHAERIKAAKAAAEPLFLPVLFIAPRLGIAKSTTSWDIVDDVVTRPLDRSELQSRVRTLLRARGLALRLRDSVMAYEREHAIASALQRAALPSELPEIPGFAFDAFYEPARDDAKIGGDWYDAVRLNDGRIVVSLGDVAGSGLEAAVTMASMRQAIRAVAQVYADPLTMLDAADRMLKAEYPNRIVTAFVGVVDPVSFCMKYASAGHPPPLLREPDGAVVELRAQSLPLGIRVREDRSENTVDVAPGSMVLFYTDGLSEATRDVLEGETRMRAALSNERILLSSRPAADIKEAVFDGMPHSDDVAILAMRVSGRDRQDHAYRWSLQTDDEASASRVRHEFVAHLRRLGSSRESLFTSELIFGELIGNVVRYAPGQLEIVLDTSGPSPVLHMLDGGRGFTLIPRLPTDLLSDRGRGLFLIWTLGEDFNVDIRPGGGAHARVVLPVEVRSGAQARERRRTASRSLELEAEI